MPTDLPTGQFDGGNPSAEVPLPGNVRLTTDTNYENDILLLTLHDSYLTMWGSRSLPLRVSTVLTVPAGVEKPTSKPPLKLKANSQLWALENRETSDTLPRWNSWFAEQLFPVQKGRTGPQKERVGQKQEQNPTEQTPNLWFQVSIWGPRVACCCLLPNTFLSTLRGLCGGRGIKEPVLATHLDGFPLLHCVHLRWPRT